MRVLGAGDANFFVLNMQEDQTGFTQLLEAAGNGDRSAAEAVMPLVYDELRELARMQMAREPAGLTFQPTALVHEAFLRLGAGQEMKWENRRHFFGAAAQAMRRILIERARRAGGPKQGGGFKRLLLDETPAPGGPDPIDWLALDEALAALEEHDPELAEIVSMRYFAGLSIDQTAQTLGVSPRSVDRSWRAARAFLLVHIEGSDSISADRSRIEPQS